MWAHLDKTAADRELVAQDMGQDHARDAAGGHAHGGLASRGAAAATRVADAILLPVGVVSVARPELVGDIAVVLGPLVLVLDDQRDGRAGGLPLEDAGDDLNGVGLLALGGVAGLAGLAPVEPDLQLLRAQGNERRDPIDDTANLRPVALAPGREAKSLTEGIASHAPSPRTPLPPVGRSGLASSFGVEAGEQFADLAGGIDRHHPDHIVAGIDVMHLSGDAAGKIAQQVETGAADCVR